MANVASIFRFRIKTRDIVVAALCGAVNAVLQIISTFFTPIPGLSVFYPPSGFGAATAVWFGFWGWIGAVLGTLFAAPYWGYSLPVALAFGFLTPWEVLIPAVIWRVLKLDAQLKGAKSFAIYLGIVAVVGTFLDAVFGMLVSVFAGFYSTGFAFTVAIWPWWLADLVACAVLGFILLRSLTPYMKRIGMIYDGFFARRLVSTSAPPAPTGTHADGRKPDSSSSSSSSSSS